MSKAQSRSGLLIVMCGPSGVGKSTLARRLAARLNLLYVTSVTTRPRLPGDEGAKSYEHVGREEFLARLDRGEFLEYAEMYGHWYGTPRQPILANLEAGRDLLLEIDVQGALQVRSQCPEALLIFILPPDECTLLKRLEGRARDSAEEVARRFRAARREIEMARGSRAFDHMVVNDDLEKSVEELVRIVEDRRALQKPGPHEVKSL